MRSVSQTRTAKSGVPYEYIVLIDAETAAALFANPSNFASDMEANARRLVASWNEKNGDASTKGLRVSWLSPFHPKGALSEGATVSGPDDVLIPGRDLQVVDGSEGPGKNRAEVRPNVAEFRAFPIRSSQCPLTINRTYNNPLFPRQGESLHFRDNQRIAAES
jgi:hypothetical protein